jgi:LPXTG-motif cell wall-anchored protein
MIGGVMRFKGLMAVLGAAMTSLVVAGVAAAAPGATSVTAYGGNAGGTQGALHTAGKTGTLPFTGANLFVAVLIGIALVSLGIVFRRRAGA